jgi:hypothetical protein
VVREVTTDMHKQEKVTKVCGCGGGGRQAQWLRVQVNAVQSGLRHTHTSFTRRKSG